jgi:SAM-dependent methyltransferase
VTQGVDWRAWLLRWEAQQSGGLPQREERFQVMTDFLGALAGAEPLVVDLGSGPGSLAVRVVERLPGARVVAVDADPLLLELGRRAVGDRGGRIRWLERDLRDPVCWEALRTERPFDAAISTTALHWLSPPELVALCERLADLIRPGGVFLNGDHLTFGLDQARIAAAAQELRAAETAREQAARPAETWQQWWQAVDADPGLAPLVAERRARWRGHPDYHLPGERRFLGAALLRVGFVEVATVWQRLDDHVVIAVR